jgi:hypothetical protein
LSDKIMSPHYALPLIDTHACLWSHRQWNMPCLTADSVLLSGHLYENYIWVMNRPGSDCGKNFLLMTQRILTIQSVL